MSEDPAHKAMLYFLEILMNSNGPLTISQLAGRFGSRTFSPDMRLACGGNEQGLKKFLMKYPSLFTVKVCFNPINIHLSFYFIVLRLVVFLGKQCFSFRRQIGSGISAKQRRRQRFRTRHASPFASGCLRRTRRRFLLPGSSLFSSPSFHCCDNNNSKVAACARNNRCTGHCPIG